MPMGLGRSVASGIAGAAVGWSTSALSAGGDSGAHVVFVVGVAAFAVILLTNVIVGRDGPPRLPPPRWPRGLRPVPVDFSLEPLRRPHGAWVPPVLRYPSLEP